MSSKWSNEGEVGKGLAIMNMAIIKTKGTHGKEL